LARQLPDREAIIWCLPSNISRLMSATSRRRFLDIVRLRYRLQWAQIRRSPGRLLWFLFIQIVVMCVAAAGAILGFGALVVAVQTGRATGIVQAILGGIYVNGLVASLVFGYGLNQAFSDKALRRYPFSHTDRFVIRHLLALTEPLWIIAIAAYGGVAIGAAALGVAPLWVTVPVLALLVTSNYLVVRTLLGLSDLLMASALGSLLLFATLQLVFLIPMSMRLVFSDPARSALLRQAIAFTPPVAVGSILMGAAGGSALLLLAAWCAVPVVLLFWLDRRPEVTDSGRSGKAAWNGPLDRLAALFPSPQAPLVARGLRFYLRNQQVQLGMIGLIITLGVMPFYLARQGFSRGGGSIFDLTLLLSPLVATVTAALSSNAFGFEGSGTRRLLSAPVSRRMILGSISLSSVLIGSVYFVGVIALWVALTPIHVEPRMVLMLLTHGASGLCLYHAIAVWTTILTPARANYFEKFRRQSSTGARVTGFFMMFIMLGSILTRRLVMRGDVIDYWWLSCLVLMASIGIFLVSLSLATPVFERRRERLLSVVEGRI
jgi:hypothetical protein